MLDATKQTLAKEHLSQIAQLVKLRYEEEVQREASLISQSSSMQTVFSVFSAALFMLLPTIIDVEYRGKLELNMIFVFVSIIAFFLSSSLVLATIAQSRKKRKMFASIQALIEEVSDTTKLTKNLENPFALTSKLINSYSEAYNSLSANNNYRVTLIRISMWMFYCSIGACVVFYSVSTYILFS